MRRRLLLAVLLLLLVVSAAGAKPRPRGSYRVSFSQPPAIHFPPISFVY